MTEPADTWEYVEGDMPEYNPHLPYPADHTSAEPGSIGTPRELPEGLTLHRAKPTDSPLVERLEHDVFVGAGYSEARPSGRLDEYLPYQDNSLFHIVSTPDGSPVAAVRTIVGTWDELPTGKDFTRDWDFPHGLLLDYTTTSVLDGYRGAGISSALWRSVFQESLHKGCHGLAAITARWLLDLLNHGFGTFFHQVGPGRWYMGDHCFPMGVSIEECLCKMTATQPETMAWFLDGVNADDIPSVEIRAQLFAARKIIELSGIEEK